MCWFPSTLPAAGAPSAAKGYSAIATTRPTILYDEIDTVFGPKAKGQ
jgi:hypothetical protein